MLLFKIQEFYFQTGIDIKFILLQRLDSEHGTECVFYAIASQF